MARGKRLTSEQAEEFRREWKAEAARLLASLEALPLEKLKEAAQQSGDYGKAASAVLRMRQE
ncbi:hypothetical protein KSF_098960 [Reticulibacter mediterranei]|uniref:Uncharacterized protein n=1 Tax=Reticulibacter mediterranei TaxID=2778369 RepID=A0A8J3N8M4_9CHLR|nr:hypothetical protein [Reticulibacter mediterranei]GHO99848.1 hypothetical protein KSF_098960 [Reticulibacter mediterranei]